MDRRWCSGSSATGGVATAPEPWRLLPHAYTLRQQGVDAEYVDPLVVEAIGGFCQGLPGGEKTSPRCATRPRLYEKSAGEDANYFLERRPRMRRHRRDHAALPRRQVRLPLANPLSVVASLIKTWGPWYPTFMSSDLFIGLPRPVAAYESNRDAFTPPASRT